MRAGVSRISLTTVLGWVPVLYGTVSHLPTSSGPEQEIDDYDYEALEGWLKAGDREASESAQPDQGYASG